MVAAIPCGHPNNLEHIDEFKREFVAWQLQRGGVSAPQSRS
jgi:hypothetical protein